MSSEYSAQLETWMGYMVAWGWTGGCVWIGIKEQ